MTSFNKKHYKELVKEANKSGNIFIATLETDKGDVSFNGLTIGFKPADTR